MTVASITIPSSADLGDAISVTWTVRNIGSDPASEGWSDRVYLSADASVDVEDYILLTMSAAFYAPLSASDEYTQTESVTLPLTGELSGGNYYILVKTDALGTQPESNEGNNLASEVISLTVPSVPDLIVSDIVAPATALAGDTIEISWTLTNQAAATPPGPGETSFSCPPTR